MNKRNKAVSPGRKILISFVPLSLLLTCFLAGCAEDTKGKIMMDNLIRVDFSGKDGSAVPHAQIDNEYLSSIYDEGDFDVNQMKYLERYISSLHVEFEPADHLANGNELRVIVKDDGDLRKKAGIRVDGLKYKVQVGDLRAADEFNPFAGVSPIFSGKNGEGKALAPIVPGLTFSVSPSEKLKNGDKVTLKLDTDEKTLLELGKKASLSEYSYTVSGLIEIKDYNPFTKIQVNFNGYEGDGKAEIQRSGENQPEHFEINKKTGLSNGDEVTVKLLDEVKDLQELGLNPTFTKKTYTVSGLEERKTLDPFSAFHLQVDGYNGDGTASWTYDLDLDPKFELSKTQQISNRDQIKVKLLTDPQYFLDHGYELSKMEAEYDIDNLPEYKEITEQYLLDNFSLLYYGYSPYIIAHLKVPETGFIADNLNIDYEDSYYKNGDTLKIKVTEKDPEELKAAGYILTDEAASPKIQIGEKERPLILTNLDLLDENSKKELDKAARSIFASTYAAMDNGTDIFLDADNHRYRKNLGRLVVEPEYILEEVCFLNKKSSLTPPFDDVLNDKYFFNRVLYIYKLKGTAEKNPVDDMHTIVSLSNVVQNPDGSISFDSNKSYSVSRVNSDYIIFAERFKEETLLANFGENYLIDTISANEYWQP